MFGFKKHCPVCGIDVKKETSLERFGKYFCSSDHAQKYADLKMSTKDESDNRGGCCC
ncbi:MAG: hypothetical protein KGI10_08330 [Thaumarchaeota archaeon]|nr:hypothetical protein [Nitrososphaerota archaeon]